jgi:hypothetical protein
LKTEDIHYRDGSLELRDAIKDKRPGILVVHEASLAFFDETFTGN